MMRDSIGQDFNTKQVNFGIRKVYAEFTKCLDPDLPFYYHTSSHIGFYEGPLPEFNEVPVTKPKTKKSSRGEQPMALHHVVLLCWLEGLYLYNQNSTIYH